MYAAPPRRMHCALSVCLAQAGNISKVVEVQTRQKGSPLTRVNQMQYLKLNFYVKLNKQSHEKHHKLEITCHDGKPDGMLSV